FDELRALFAAEPLARARAYTPSTFSFNVAGGRCDACEGAGHVLVEMVFLANVFVPCEVCAGKRFKKEVLEVKLGGSSIHDVLEWTVDQALRRFHRQPRLARALWHLQQVGLGYLRLGQPATTLSGGEAQRLKIARELRSEERRVGKEARTGRLRAEDGIRDDLVTGVQTCALPILAAPSTTCSNGPWIRRCGGFTASRGWPAPCGTCNRSGSVTCGSASRRPRSRAARRSA